MWSENVCLAYRLCDITRDFRRLSDPEVLTPPPDRFWCDPFLLQRDGALHMFVEEYLYESGGGHISMLSRSASGNWSEPRTVLERPYHMSYPFIFEHEGELLMLPETTAAGRIDRQAESGACPVTFQKRPDQA